MDKKTDKEAPKKTAIEKLNAKYSLVLEGGDVRVFAQSFDPDLGYKRIQTIKPAAFKMLHDNHLIDIAPPKAKNPRLVGLGSYWMRHAGRRTHELGTTLSPHGKTPEGYYNIWMGWGVEPKRGDYSKMLWHLRHIVCGDDEENFNYLMGWMARAVQKPNVQGETAVVLRGKKGVGKGTLGKALVDMFGGHSLHLSKSDQLVGRFNAHLRTAVLVFADEAFFAGDKKNQGSLKALITEDKVGIEPKGVDLVMGKNRTHIIMAANSDWAVPASSEERRFFVVDVSESKRNDWKYFSALKSELEGGGLAAMLHGLLAYDLSGFNVRAIPQTKALLEQKLLSQAGVEAWLYDCLQNRAIPVGFEQELEWAEDGVTIPKKDAHHQFTRRAHLYNCGYDTPLRDTWSKQIRKIISVQDTRPGGTRSLKFGGLEDCRGQFEKHMGHKIDWGVDAVHTVPPPYKAPLATGKPETEGSDQQPRRKRRLKQEKPRSFFGKEVQ
jgi:hypothetical protein